MAREEIFFGINIDTGEVIKDFGTLKRRTKELKRELDGTKVGTKSQQKTIFSSNKVHHLNRARRLHFFPIQISQPLYVDRPRTFPPYAIPTLHDAITQSFRYLLTPH